MSSESSRRKPAALGVVGTGPVGEAYLAALRQQTKPVSLKGIYDAVPARGEQAARDWQTWCAPSMTSLFERPEIDAVLVLDTAWHGWYALELAVRCHKPALVTGPWGSDFVPLEQIHLAAREAGVLLMAALPRRHCPSTNRLRELIATKLGPAKSIDAHVACRAEEAREELIGLIDWCSSVLGRAPTGITAAGPPSETERTYQLQFPAADRSASVRLTLDGEAAEQTLRVECQRGTASITSDAEILWSTDGQETQDRLVSDRSSVEIILDQFCRRVVGGLVPVADLGDVLRSGRLAERVTS